MTLQNDPALSHAPKPEETPLRIQVIRSLVFGASFALLIDAETFGLIEGRMICLICFLSGLLDPRWGLQALALLGGIFLLDASKTYLLFSLELLALGTICGELRTWKPRPAPPGGRQGIWSYWVLAIVLLLLATSLPGWITLFNIEEFTGPLRNKQGQIVAYGRPDLLLWRLDYIFFDSAASPYWPVKSLANWLTGLGIAWVASRRAGDRFPRQWLLTGALAFVGYGFVSLLDFWGLIKLTSIRRPNPDPFQAGRMQGIAGHPGWLAEWILVFWPGYLVLRSAPGKWRHLAPAGLAFAALCLLLTGARAAAMGFMTGATLLLASAVPARLKQGTLTLRRVLLAILASLVVVLLATIVGGDVLVRRLEHLIRPGDRINYYKTSLIMLQLVPWGIGIGMHSLLYESLFTPMNHAYQFDHVTSHSTFLQLLVENGAVFVIVFYTGVLLLARDVVAALKVATGRTRSSILLLLASALGFAVLSLGHYIFYIRATEMALWTIAGFLVGLSRECAPPQPLPRILPRLFALAAAVAAILMTQMHAGRDYVNGRPRTFGYVPLPGLPRDPDAMTLPAGDPRPWHESHSIWTPRKWTLAVDLDVVAMQFRLFRKRYPAQVTITWPDGVVEKTTMRAEEGRYFTHQMYPGEKKGILPPMRWLTVEVSSLYTPSRFDIDSTDDRALGVYVTNFRILRDGEPDDPDDPEAEMEMGEE